jgi:hypothetical protein
MKLLYLFILLLLVGCSAFGDAEFTLEDYKALKEYNEDHWRAIPFVHEGMIRMGGFPVVQIQNIFTCRIGLLKVDTVKYHWVLKWKKVRSRGCE